MIAIYSADPALQTAIGSALSFYGLDPSPTAAERRPTPARTFAEQMRRVVLGFEVLALVRRQAPVGADDRRLIERLVDSACERLEEADRPQPPARKPVNDAAMIAYAVAGGGAVGSFESFRRSFLSSAELLEPVDRQDVQPPPLTTNPIRRPQGPRGPGAAAPVKTNPNRAIRSSRWTAGRKGVRS
jgi:hypothetical protein